MGKHKKTPAVEIVPAPPAASPPPPAARLPATYVNNGKVEWADGVVRLELGDQPRDGAAEVRLAVVMTAIQARMLAGILTQAADALLPPEPVAP